MKEGEVSGLLSSSYGFHFFFLEKVYSQKFLGLSEVREKILNILMQQKKELAYSVWLNGVLENTKIEFL